MNHKLVLSLFQVVCLGCGIGAATGVAYFGERYDYGQGAHPGVGGAALGCGVIAAACIVCCVWIELSKTKL